MNNKKPYVWGKMPDEREVICYPLERGQLKAEILNLGGIVYSLLVPGRNGQMVDVMLGFDTPEEYLQSDTYFGAIVGRYANRIAEAQFELDGTTYQLEVNNGRNNLHSGKNGFHQYLFEAEYDETRPHRVVLRGTNTGVEKDVASVEKDVVGVGKDLVGDRQQSQGFPGTLQVTITYELTEDNALNITYEATTDKATPVNMTWHGYFNLDGHDAGNILGHNVKINADHYTPFQDENMIPSGAIEDVAETPFDFRGGKTIGRDIAEKHTQLIIGGGYDHNFVFSSSYLPKDEDINETSKHTSSDADNANAVSQHTSSIADNANEVKQLQAVATVEGERSGIMMQVLTDRPCMQLYTGNFIVTQQGKQGATYEHRQGFCMETQTYPNAVNCKAFPSDILQPGEVYKTGTSYRFE